MSSKFVYFVAMLLTTFSISAQEKVYTDKGYPYKNLVEKSKEVKIIYRESNESITCRVDIAHAQTSFEGVTYNVSKRQFKRAPLASCLERQDAKTLLEKVTLPAR
ncbi:hypothetical protein OE749_10325 [Aestuariibacter sp. AA17]|uniref:Uncharacterized protein n=1 Tax=Fluctibacter corallii TaxID=2984329 RepID=A0ABT3A8T0_9ALTE|nr:hypothetical protein [Aestuariibacter sp. AA17]MCV2885086.1 hypothetical protein [Aestuariibacter sp. AA17]